MDYELDFTHSENHEDHDHHHHVDVDVEKLLEQMHADFSGQLKQDEETIRLIADLAGGKEKWDQLIANRLAIIDEIIEWNSDTLDPLLEMYQMYLEDNSDDMMMQFNVLENRRLLMRDFFITKTLLAKIGSDVNSIEKRLKKIEKSIQKINAGS